MGDRQVLECLNMSARPANLEPLNPRSVAQTEVQHRLVRRHESPRKGVIADLSTAGSSHADHGIHPVRIAPRAAKSDLDAAPRLGVVAVERNWVVVSVDNNVQITVIVQVGKRRAETDIFFTKAPFTTNILER